MSERLFAPLALRVLLDAASVPAPEALEWGQWQHLAQQNAVMVRLAERLEQRSIHPPAAFREAAARERARGRSVSDAVRRVAAGCERRAIPHVFLKAHRHYPDMGRDVDLLVLGEPDGVDAPLAAELGATPRPRDLSAWAAAATTFLMDGGVVLDVHHGRLGHCGEQRLFARLLVERRRAVEIAGGPVWVPSPEHEVVLQALELVRGRASFRLAEVLYTISVVRDESLDWASLIAAARQVGALASVSCYLAYVGQIHERVFARGLLPEAVARQLRLAGWGPVEFTRGAFRFPALRVSTRLYAGQLGADVRSGRWDSAGRLCLLPLLVAAAGLRRLRAAVAPFFRRR